METYRINAGDRMLWRSLSTGLEYEGTVIRTEGDEFLLLLDAMEAFKYIVDCEKANQGVANDFCGYLATSVAASGAFGAIDYYAHRNQFRLLETLGEDEPMDPL